MALYATQPLGAHHDRSDFSCGVEPLDRYLHQQASQDARRNITNVFVLEDSGSGRIVGYYTLSMTSIVQQSVPANVARRLPRNPFLPAALIGRLAVDARFHGQRHGTTLILDAFRRSLTSAEHVAAFAVVVDAKDDAAR